MRYNRNYLRLSYSMLVITLFVLSDILSSNRIPDGPNNGTHIRYGEKYHQFDEYYIRQIDDSGLLFLNHMCPWWSQLESNQRLT